jgi:UTP:GlnB (protein PII) uridylyltransferase
VDARLITSANGFSLETYVVLEDNGAVIADSDRIGEIERGCGATCSSPRIRR